MWEVHEQNGLDPHSAQRFFSLGTQKFSGRKNGVENFLGEFCYLGVMLDSRVMFFCLGVVTTVVVRRVWNWLSTGSIGV
jgi:hypothetical protein